MPFDFKKIVGVWVVLEGRTKNYSVGKLTMKKNKFHFEYENAYLFSRNISLGPEMPKTRRVYESDELFRPFTERFPSRENPAYPEYCASVGISVDETDPFILLTTIAARGPSSFIFKPLYEESFNGKDLKKYRNNLGLSVREFAACFDFSPAGITRVETGTSDGREILKRAEIYTKYPQVALNQLRRRQGYLHEKKVTEVRKLLESN